MPIPLLLPLLLAPAACRAPVLITGVVEDGPTNEADPLANALVTMRERSGEIIDYATTDAQGRFAIEVGAGLDLYAIVTNDEGIEASFTGAAGRMPTLELPAGELYGVTGAQVQAWRALFEGCPSLEEPGGIAIGQVHVYLPGVTPDNSTIVVTATATAFSSTAASEEDGLQGCYLNDEGTAYDPTATWTGSSGMYAIGGIPEGGTDILVEFQITEEVSQSHVMVAWMPTDGVVARFPTFVDFPLDL